MRTRPLAEDAASELLRRVTSAPVSSYHDLRTGMVRISAHVRQLPAPGRQLLAALRRGLHQLRQCGLEPGRRPPELRRLPPKDWAEAWKQHFPPLEIGSALLIRPSWSKQRARPGQRVLVLDPGLSFGTGHHPTTRFCLERLVFCRDSTQRQSFLDIGTGSGLLALAAARLGYAPVIAFDHDAQAVRTARNNAKRNRLLQRIRLRLADLCEAAGPAAPAHHVVCANLTTDLLLAERQRIGSRVRPGGHLILAGMLRGESNSVRTAYAKSGFDLVSRAEVREWSSLHLQRGCH